MDRTAAIDALLLWHEAYAFLVREARALDEEDYETWFGLLAPDLHYWMPTRETLFRADEAPDDPRRMYFYNETVATLRQRVARLGTGTAWSENPRTRYRHLVTNVEVEPGSEADTLAVRSNVLVYRNRLERDEYWLVAAREDQLRRDDGGLKLARRKITLDQNTLLSKNLNVYL
jgi:ethylbenzene dioxygenase beta subunit